MILSKSKHYRVQQHAVGIDTADGSLELVNCVALRDGTIAMQEHARIQLQPNTILHGIIQNEAVLSAAFDLLFVEARLDPRGLTVISALPDSQIITKTIPLTLSDHRLGYDELDALARAYFDKLNFGITRPILAWQFAQPDESHAELILFATSSLYVEQWKKFFAKRGMSLTILEMESLAIARAFIDRCHAGETIAVIDFGFRHTNFSVFDSGGLRYSHVHEQGTAVLDNLVAEELGISATEATKSRATLSLAIKPKNRGHQLVHEYFEEITSALAEPLSIYNSTLKHIVITGPGSHQQGLVAMIAHKLKHPVQRGTFWFSTTRQKKWQLQNMPLTQMQQQLYAGAAGLALRGLDRVSLAKGINFLRQI